MKPLILIITALSVIASPVQAQDAPIQPPVEQPPAVTTTGSITSGVLQTDNSTSSSKLTEYRDFRDTFFVPQLRLNLFDTRNGGFVDLRGANVSRNDQSVSASFGRVNQWDVRVNWNEVPHNFSNHAQTPYILRGPGLFEVPATVPITFKKLATAAADTAGVLASDDLIASYQRAFLHPTSLTTQNNFGRVAFDAAVTDALRFSAAYDRIRKDGARATYGPIGDRPPRTLNIQLTEPVDYRTNQLTLAAEHQGARYVAQFEYLYSDFANEVDTLVWQNVYATAQPGATYDVWDRAVSTFGRRPLPPDNRYHNLSFGLAGDLPLDSRLSARVAYGRMEQNEPLLPYSFNSDILADSTLPRATAGAEMTTTQVLVDYVINPAPRLNVRAWMRRFGLDNNTPQENWRYVTSDTPNLNGTVTFLNKRVNVAYASDRTNVGVDTTYRLPARTSLVAGYERESLNRDFREADTTEDRLSLALRTRATHWANLRVRYILGSRSGDGYNDTVTRQTYWYTLPEVGADNNNPAFTFDNHPDMRRFDVSDRRRQQFDVTLNLIPTENVTLSGAVRYRSDDFESDVRSVQPLNMGVGEVAAATPGQQLGLLDDSRLQYSLDLFYMPVPRFTFNAFLSRDRGTSFQRGLEFNENNKANPSTVATAALGPWTRASSQWTADFNDTTWNGGAGVSIQLVPERATLSLNYTASLADVDISYAGYGVTNWDGTPYAPNSQFAFTSPPRVVEDLHVADVRLEVPVAQRLTLLVSYSFERYRLNDWQQNAVQSWVEPVGSEFLLRDSSRSFQWGNRLFNLGTPLAPQYDAHIAFVAMAYRF